MSAGHVRAQNTRWRFSWEGSVNAALSGRDTCDKLREWIDAVVLEAQAGAVREGVSGGVNVPEGLQATMAGGVLLA